MTSCETHYYRALYFPNRRNIVKINAAKLFLSFSYSGAAISVVVALTSAPVMAVVYVWARGLHKQTWGGWGWDSLRGWGQFAKLGVPGLLMVCIEWWSFEIAAFVTGSINKTELGVHAVLISLLSIVFMVSMVLLWLYGMGDTSRY